MTNYTPAPWQVKYSTKRNGGPFEGWTEYDIHANDGCFLVLRQYPGGAEADANAALIAAAPDLLEALRAIVSSPTCADPDCCAASIKHAAAMDLCRAAIAKAEGK